MHKTDSKIRLFFELTYQKDVQITEYIPLKNASDKWKPEKMYLHPNRQYYYVFINDPELIERIKEGEEVSQEYLYDLIKDLENYPETEISEFYIEFNATSIDNIKKNNTEEQYIILARVSIDNFSFINDFKTASKADLIEKNKPLIYANKGRIKEYLIGKKAVDMLNSSLHSNKDEKKEEENDDKTSNNKKKNEEQFINYIPGNWFLINMNNLNYIKKNVLDDTKKQKLIKFLSLIKYKEVTPIEQDPNNSQDLNYPQNNNNINNNTKNNNTSENNKNKFKVDMTYQQPQEFAFRPSENSKLITVYQPKSCKSHFKKNDFWCKTCNQFCCLECLTGDNDINTHKNHKIHLLEEILNKSEEDSNALDERIKSLKKIIEGEIADKQNELRELKEQNGQIVKAIEKLYGENNDLIRQEELKRTKALAALVNEILRINDENNKRINYLNKLYENRSMNEYLTNYFIYKNIFVKQTKKNLEVLERKVVELINYYKKNQNIE